MAKFLEINATARFDRIDPKTAGHCAECFFMDQWNCAESVFKAVCEQSGITAPTYLATGFGGGIGGNRRICGAITGAVLAIGLRYGRLTNHPDAKLFCYDKTSRLMDAFVNEFHFTNCWELSGDRSPDEKKEICRRIVRFVAEEASYIIQR